MESLLLASLFGSALAFWGVFLLFVIICFVADVNEAGYAATVALVILSIVIYIWGDIKSIMYLFTVASVVGYLLIGLGFSVFRTFFAGRKLGKEIRSADKNKNKEYIKSSFINEMQGNVFRWWFMWPISLLSWVATDFIVNMWELIYSKVSKFYNYMLELGIKSIGL